MQFDFSRAHTASNIKKVNGTHLKIFSRADGWIQVPHSGLRCEVHEELDDHHSVLIDTDEDIPPAEEGIAPSRAPAAKVKQVVLAADSEERFRFFFKEARVPLPTIHQS